MKSIRGILLLSGVIMALSVGAVFFMMFYGPDHIEWQGRSFQDLLESGDIVPCFVVPITLVIVGLSMLPFRSILFPTVIKNGVAAEAKILKVWDTGTTINDNPQVGMLLEFNVIGVPVQAEAKTIVSRLNVALVQPGATADIKYDPQNPKRVEIVTLNILPPEPVPNKVPAIDASSRMEELNELRLKGLITEEEYTRKREEILKAL